MQVLFKLSSTAPPPVRHSSPRHSWTCNPAAGGLARDRVNPTQAGMRRQRVDSAHLESNGHFILPDGNGLEQTESRRARKQLR